MYCVCGAVHVGPAFCVPIVMNPQIHLRFYEAQIKRFLWNGPTEEMSLPGLKPRTAALDEMGSCETNCHSSLYNNMQSFYNNMQPYYNNMWLFL